MESNEQLAIKAQSDQSLILDLWSANQPLIRQTVKRFECPEYPEEIDQRGNKSRNPDLMQESYLCLVECLPDYDQDKGRFISFYLQRLKWHLIRIINTNKGISVPAWFTSLQAKYNRYVNDYYMEHGYYPDDNTVADALKMDFKTLGAVKGINLNVTSLNTVVGGSDDDDIELWETIEGDPAAKIEDCVTSLYNSELWLSLARVLKDRELDILADRFRHDLSLDAIGKKYGITKERARQIIDTSLTKIRTNGLCVRELMIDGDTERKKYYLGGFGYYRNNIFTSNVEKIAIQNTQGHFRRKQRQRLDSVEDISKLEEELKNIFGDAI